MSHMVRGSRATLTRYNLYNKQVTVGADPEYEFVNDGEVTSCDNYMPHEGVSVGEYISYVNHFGGIGVDGSGLQIELRPRYTKTPHEFLISMRGLFDKVKQYELWTSGNVLPLGGHIHIGCGMLYQPPDGLIYSLDYFLGARSLTLCGSARGPYARISAHEVKDWGFEYRTPPAAIFHTPTSTRLHLKIAKGVCDRYFAAKRMDIGDSYGTADCMATWEELGIFLNALEIIQLQGFYKAYKKMQKNTVACWVKPSARVTLSVGREDEYEEDEPTNRRQIGMRDRDFFGANTHGTRFVIRDQWGDRMFDQVREDISHTLGDRIPYIPIIAYGLGAARGDRAMAVTMAGSTAAEHCLMEAAVHTAAERASTENHVENMEYPAPYTEPTLMLGFARNMRDDNGYYYHSAMDTICELDFDLVENLYDVALCRYHHYMAFYNVLYRSLEEVE